MTRVKLKLEEVFRTEGLPEFTFVPPPNYNEILLDIRHSHKPVILEGQSGTGKTSCVRHILDELSRNISARATHSMSTLSSGSSPPDWPAATSSTTSTLEEAACECYRTIRRRTEAVFHTPQTVPI
jgi:MoxR-like ATPase